MKIKIKNPIYGVPITFLGNYCSDQFEIVSFRKEEDGKDLSLTSIPGMIKNSEGCINGLMNNPKDTKISKKKTTYARIIIRHK